MLIKVNSRKVNFDRLFFLKTYSPIFKDINFYAILSANQVFIVNFSSPNYLAIQF